MNTPTYNDLTPENQRRAIAYSLDLRAAFHDAVLNGEPYVVYESPREYVETLYELQLQEGK